MTRKSNFNSVLTRFLYETFPGDKSKQKDRVSDRDTLRYSVDEFTCSRSNESRFKLDPVFEDRYYCKEPTNKRISNELSRRYEQHVLYRSSTLSQPPTIRDSSHSKKRYSIDSKLEDSSFLSESANNPQSLENCLNQIIQLEKDKRQIMLDRKTWKKRCIRAETEQVTQAREFKEDVRKLKERYDSDLEKLRLLHQERCGSLSSQLGQLTEVSDTYRYQLLQHGIEPTLLRCNDTLDEDRKYIEDRYKKLRYGQKQEKDSELDSTVEYLIQALTHEFTNYSRDTCKHSLGCKPS